MSRFSTFIKLKAEEAKLQSGHIGAACAVEPMTAEYWLNGRRLPPPDRLHLLAMILRCDVDELVEEYCATLRPWVRNLYHLMVHQQPLDNKPQRLIVPDEQRSDTTAAVPVTPPSAGQQTATQPATAAPIVEEVPSEQPAPITVPQTPVGGDSASVPPVQTAGGGAAPVSMIQAMVQGATPAATPQAPTSTTDGNENAPSVAVQNAPPPALTPGESAYLQQAAATVLPTSDEQPPQLMSPSQPSTQPPAQQNGAQSAVTDLLSAAQQIPQSTDEEGV